MKTLSVLPLIFALLFLSCSTIDEPKTDVNYVLYQYRNNVGDVATNQITTVTEFAFDSKGVLGKVNEGIVNGKVAKRPIMVPDGQWTVLSFGNLTNASEVIDITTNAAPVVGKTQKADMQVRLKSQPPANLLSYANENADIPSVGYSDRLYFGKVTLDVNKGKVSNIHRVEMSNSHIWLAVTLIFADPSQIPASKESLYARLEHVPYEYTMLSDDKKDNFYGIDYSTPRITKSLATLLTSLKPVSSSTGELKFDIYGMRWNSGKAPMLSFWDGNTPLILNADSGLAKEIDLNRYFADNGVDLTNTRVQFFSIVMKVAPDGTVSASDISFDSWEEGGDWS